MNEEEKEELKEQVEEPTDEKKETKKKPIHKWLIILWIIVVLLAIGYLIYLKVNLSQEKTSPETKEEIQEDSKEKEDEKTPIKKCETITPRTNPYTILNILIGGRIRTEDCQWELLDEKTIYESEYRVFLPHSSNRLIDNYDKEKAKIVLSNIGSFSKTEPIDSSKISEATKNKFKNLAQAYGSFVNDYDENGIFKYGKSVTYDEANKAFQLLFGDNMEREDLYGTCGSPVFYDDQSDSFIYPRIIEEQCDSGSILYYYINRTEEQDDYLNVYINIGNNQGDKVLYNDFTSRDVVIENFDYETFKMDEKNYSFFKEYKYTFKKREDGSYYFVSFE